MSPLNLITAALIFVNGLVCYLTTGLSDDQQTPTKLMVDKAFVGMTIAQLKSAYQSSKFVQEPVYYYGVDGTSNGFVVVTNEQRLFFVWTLDGSDKIHGITILSPTINIDGNIRVGMSLAEFLAKYPDNKFAIDMSDNGTEFSFVKTKGYRVECLTTDSTRIAEYDFEAGEPEFKRLVVTTAKIDRISIK